MEVGRSGYYRYLKIVNRLKVDKDFELISKVREIHKRSKRSYGSRRISKALRSEGNDIGRCRARNLMKKANIAVKHNKKFKKTTDSKHDFPVAANLLNRAFKTNSPDVIWCGDITYVWTMEGWLYLSVLIDLYSRKVIGWATSDNLKAPLVIEAFLMAYWRRKPEKGLIHHSDRGVQYACHDYQELLETNGVISSMSRKGDCWDNAVAESFFHSLKTEWFEDVYQTRAEARSDIIEYIEMFYNSQRLHSSLGYMSPNKFEENNIWAKAA